MNIENRNIDALNELLRQNLLQDKSGVLESQILNRKMTYEANPAKIEELITALDKNIDIFDHSVLNKFRRFFLNKWILLSVFSGLLISSIFYLNNRSKVIELKNNDVLEDAYISITHDSIMVNTKRNDSAFVKITKKDYSIIKSEKVEVEKYIHKQDTHIIENEKTSTVSTQIEKTVEKPKNVNTTTDTLIPQLSTLKFDIYFKDNKDVKLSNSSISILDSIGEYLANHPKCELFIVEKNKCRRKILLRRIESINKHLRKYNIYSSRIEFRLTPDFNKTKRKGTQYKREKYFKLNVRNEKSQNIVLYISNSISAD